LITGDDLTLRGRDETPLASVPDQAVGTEEGVPTA
jgi:hypothetical protein